MKIQTYIFNWKGQYANTLQKELQLISSKIYPTVINSDEQYIASGACICERNEVIEKNTLLLTIHVPEELATIESGKIFIGIYAPLSQVDLVHQFVQIGATVFSLDMLPRKTRAQAMDVLSSQANIAGYKAVLTAATQFPRYFPIVQ